MKLQELKDLLDELYGFDISADTRKREYAYARKVFCKIAYDYGYRWKDIKVVIGISHDLCIYHHGTFNAINPIDLHNYNTAIKYFELPMEQIPSMSWYINGEMVQGIIEKLKKFSIKDLKYFEINRIDKFLKAVQDEKEIKSLNYE